MKSMLKKRGVILPALVAAIAAAVWALKSRVQALRGLQSREDRSSQYITPEVGSLLSNIRRRSGWL